MMGRALGVLWLLWGLAGAWGCAASAGPALVVPVPAAYVSGAHPLFPQNTYEAHIRNLLLAGKVADALSYAKEQYGRVPAWLRSYAAAFDAASQAVGRCREVAKAIHSGLSRVGEKPEYVAIRSDWAYVSFELPSGKHQTLTRTGYHVVVKFRDMIYDAYTGPAGMKSNEYISRLAVPSPHHIETNVVTGP